MIAFRRNPHLLIAVIVSTSGLLVLLNGAMGTDGNPALTGALALFPALALLALGDFRDIALTAIDVLFLVFVGCIGVSMVANGYPHTKETALLALSLFAYPACRFIRPGESPWSFIVVTGAVVVAGAIATAFALASQWSYLEHPTVFGFFHAATVFLTSLGFLVIFQASAKADWKVLSWVTVPLAIFAAAMVRFTFVAIVVGLLAAAATSVDRKRVLGIVAMVCIAAAAGFAVRYKAAELHLAQDVAESITDPQPCPENNTISMRRIVLREAVRAVPSAGLFGHGLGWFENVSCVKIEPHNSFLQAFVEFGWPAGLAFVLLVAIALLRLWPLATEIVEARFVLCSLIYLATLSLAYGEVSREGLLFLFLGYAARLRERYQVGEA